MRLGSFTLSLLSLPFMPSLFAAESFPYPPSAPFYYLSCGATGVELGDKNRLVCEDSYCIWLGLEYTVDSPSILEEGDTCSLITTKHWDLLDDSSERFVPYVEFPDHAPVIGEMTVPSMGRLYRGDSFKVKYPQAGVYKISVTRARGAFRIESATR